MAPFFVKYLEKAFSLLQVEQGVPKEKLAMLAIPMMPLQIILPWIISRYTAGPRPMDVFLKAMPPRSVYLIVLTIKIRKVFCCAGWAA